MRKWSLLPVAGRTRQQEAEMYKKLQEKFRKNWQQIGNEKVQIDIIPMDDDNDNEVVFVEEREEGEGNLGSREVIALDDDNEYGNNGVGRMNSNEKSEESKGKEVECEKVKVEEVELDDDEFIVDKNRVANNVLLNGTEESCNWVSYGVGMNRRGRGRGRRRGRGRGRGRTRSHCSMVMQKKHVTMHSSNKRMRREEEDDDVILVGDEIDGEGLKENDLKRLAMTCNGTNDGFIDGNDDNQSTKNNCKKGKFSHREMEQQEVDKILTACILNKIEGPLACKETSKVHTKQTLPLKFTFGVEETPPQEKSEEEKELDALWKELAMALREIDANTDNSTVENV